MLLVEQLFKGAVHQFTHKGVFTCHEESGDDFFLGLGLWLSIFNNKLVLMCGV